MLLILLLLLWSLFLIPSTSILFIFLFNFLFILQPEFIDDFLIFREDACLYFLLFISLGTRCSLREGPTSLWCDVYFSWPTGFAWFVGILGLGMTRGVAQLDARVLETEMAKNDADIGSVLVMADEDKFV